MLPNNNLILRLLLFYTIPYFLLLWKKVINWHVKFWPKVGTIMNPLPKAPNIKSKSSQNLNQIHLRRVLSRIWECSMLPISQILKIVSSLQIISPQHQNHCTVNVNVSNIYSNFDNQIYIWHNSPGNFNRNVEWVHFQCQPKSVINVGKIEVSLHNSISFISLSVGQKKHISFISFIVSR